MNAHDESSFPVDPLPPIPDRLLQPFIQQNQLDFEIAFYGRIIEQNPNYVDVLRVLGNNLTAKGDYFRGLEIDRRLARLRPTDGVAHYNLACSYALLGKVDPAFESLRKAIECGYDEFEYLQEDRDLEILRKDPRFHDLLRSLGIAGQ